MSGVGSAGVDGRWPLYEIMTDSSASPYRDITGSWGWPAQNQARSHRNWRRANASSFETRVLVVPNSRATCDTLWPKYHRAMAMARRREGSLVTALSTSSCSAPSSRYCWSGPGIASTIDESVSYGEPSERARRLRLLIASTHTRSHTRRTHAVKLPVARYVPLRDTTRSHTSCARSSASCLLYSNLATRARIRRSSRVTVCSQLRACLQGCAVCSTPTTISRLPSGHQARFFSGMCCWITAGNCRNR